MEHAHAPNLDRIMELVRERGGRVTGARRAVATALLDGGHVSASELLDAVQSSNPELSPSTVYRNLELFDEMGLLHQFQVGREPTRYGFRQVDHCHIMCDSCGAVVDLPEHTVERFAALLDKRHGFELRASHLVIPGRCAGCR